LHLRDAAGNEDDGLGMLTGLLIGILGGSFGVLLGGAVGLLAGAIVDADNDEEADRVLEHISRRIGNGQTAVLADVDESGPAAVDGVMAEVEGNASRCAREDVEAEIAAAEKAAHEERVEAGKELRHERRAAIVEKVQAKLRQLRERLGHRVQH
jgi:uncharacterized membrane protein